MHRVMVSALALGLLSPAWGAPGARRCPAGEVVVGLEADGALICERPPHRPRPRRLRSGAPQLNVDAQGRTHLPRNLITQVLDHPAEAGRMMRVLPAIQDGKVMGFKVFGIRRSSLPGRLGLKNGDTVNTLAGHRLRTPVEAMAAWQAIAGTKPGDVIKVELIRRGEPTTLQVVIDPPSADAPPLRDGPPSRPPR